MAVKITLERERLYIRFRFNELDVIKAKALPDRRWNKTAKAWTCKPTLANITHIAEVWPDAEWSEEADAERKRVNEKVRKRAKTLFDKEVGGIDVSPLDSVVFKKSPMLHQKEALMLGTCQAAFAYLMDQGTGKTKVLIDDACQNWRDKNIDVVLVFTINSVKTNWVIFDCMKDEPEDTDALEDHIPDDVPYVKGVWVSQPTAPIKKEWRKFEKAISEQVTLRKKMVWLSANIESLRVARAYDFFDQIVDAFEGRVMIVIDESTIIGATGSQQSKAAKKLRKKCAMARIMSGTPVIKSPLKAFSQFQFLDEDILGFGSFYSFRNHFAVMGGYEGKQVLYYQNLDELQQMIASCSYRVLKDDCLDLPPQTFLKRRVEMTKDQLKAYREMQEHFVTENEKAGRVEAKIVLEQMLRLQQITGGYLPQIDPETEKVVGVVPLVEPKKNPKFKEVLHLLEEGGDQRMLIWTRFTHEVLDLLELLEHEGHNVLPFYGGLSDREKISVRKTFARDNKVRGIVGNPAAGGLGIDEFKYASLIAYVTNSFDTERRVQSQDRTHRIGSEMHADTGITYYDIIIPNTVDIKVMQTMRSNAKVSAKVMQDEWREWI